ncbi:hypothetical protein CSHISOI_08132 [Colletotrichum shisoi]|uniref:Proteophosphoglycan ppg4 n=1 Tax=Colletotrichum shisoi TaxID=2078593 RepID=A0A5Q4BL80_9PEZI|nr:hypothetical protein CSHISOI_08132 [Colletotrichum shisoi]
MGNTHSTESLQNQRDYGESNGKRSPHKLSKPRVGNHASPTPSTQAPRLLSSHSRTASSSLPPSRSNSQFAPQVLSRAPSPVRASTASQLSTLVPALDDPLAEPETRPTKNWKRRASLFRSKSSHGPRKDRRRDTLMLGPPVPDRMSRANSMTWETQREMNTSRQVQVESWHVPGNRQSINYNLMSYESRRLLNLTEDLAACEESSIVSDNTFEVSLNTWKSSHPHQPAVAQLPRANSEVSLYAPVRRRSVIQTPGLATRLPTESPTSRRSSLRYSGPTTPAGGRSRLNSIESSAHCIQPLIEVAPDDDYLPPPTTEPVERALTPSDMDYRPLGFMKFGSLRITNGAASPLPSPDFVPHSKAEVTKSRNGNEEHYLIQDTDPGKSESESKNVETTASTMHASTALSPINTSILAVESRRLRPNSPLGPESQTTSKHTALEYELFADDVQLEYSAEILTVRNDPNAKPSLERLRAEQSHKNSLAISRTDSGVVASPTAEQPKSLSKADSGYSSNISLRSFHGKQPAAGNDHRRCAALEDSEDEQSDSIVSPIAAVSNGSPNIDPIDQADDLAADPPPPTSSTLPPLPPKDEFLASPKSTKMTVTSPKFFFNLNTAGHSFRKDRKVPTVIASANPAENGPTSSESVRLGGASSNKSASALSIGTGSQRAGKFQRLMSGYGMRGPPAVHATHPSDNPVPSVPGDVQARLDEHSERFPTTSKRPTLRTQASKDTLNTIFSVGSNFFGVAGNHAEAEQGPLLLVDAGQVARKPAEVSEKSRIPRRRSFQSIPASIAHAASSVMPRRSIHRKPLPSASTDRTGFGEEPRTDEIQVGFESSITAIDNVGESVGKSAFDQAFMALAHHKAVHAPRERTLTMTAQMERSMVMPFHPIESMTPISQHPDPRTSQVPDLAAKRKTSPPISLHTRNPMNARKQAPRPKSAHSSETNQSRRQTLSRQNSRETIHSYPSTSAAAALDDALSVPPIPLMSPRRGMPVTEQPYAMRHMTVEDKWRPTNGCGPETGQDTRPAMRSLSTSVGYHEQHQLRHRSSYESYIQSGGPVARGPPALNLSPSQSGSYYQQQLIHVQQQQWEQQDFYSPDAIQPGLSRSRSRSRSVHANDNPPYRVLHSYNSPAYRNVPIWG